MCKKLKGNVNEFLGELNSFLTENKSFLSAEIVPVDVMNDMEFILVKDASNKDDVDSFKMYIYSTDYDYTGFKSEENLEFVKLDLMKNFNKFIEIINRFNESNK